MSLLVSLASHGDRNEHPRALYCERDHVCDGLLNYVRRSFRHVLERLVCVSYSVSDRHGQRHGHHERNRERFDVGLVVAVVHSDTVALELSDGLELTLTVSDVL